MRRVRQNQSQLIVEECRPRDDATLVASAGDGPVHMIRRISVLIKGVLLPVAGAVLLSFSSTRGANPVDEYKRQIAQPLDELGKQDAPVQERRQAAAKVAEWAKMHARVVPRLSVALSDSDEQVRVKALEAVAELGPLADETIPRLAWLISNDPSEKVRALAAGALMAMYYPWHFGTAPFMEKQALAALRQALKDKSKEVRLRTAFNLWCLGPAAKPVVPALAEALKERDARDEAGHAQPSRLRVSMAAAFSLTRIGPDAKEAVPTLLELAEQSEDRELQAAALGALGGIGEQDERVLPALLAALKQPRLRAVAAQALGNFGPKRAKEVIPALLKALDTSDQPDKEYADLVQFFAIRSLAKMGPEAKVAVPRLEAVLNDPKTRFQAHMAAEEALTQLRR